MKGHITKQTASDLRPNEVLWDDTDLGFGVRRQKQVAGFIVRYRQNKRRRHVTLGTLENVTADEARLKAKILLDAARGFERPERASWAVKRSRSGLTYFGEFAKQYLNDFAAFRKKPETLRADRRNLELHILPQLGNLRLADISPRCIMRIHSSKNSTPVVANRCLALTSHIFTIAEKWGAVARGSNPCSGADRFPEKPRERLVNDDELAQLGRAIQLAEGGYKSIDWSRLQLPPRLARVSPEDWRAIAAIRLLALTGARTNEILSLRWDSIDKSRGISRLADTKTGSRLLFLPQRALLLLASIRDLACTKRSQSPFVLPGDRPFTHFQGLSAPWQRIRAVAHLDDLRVHDLRHIFASAAVSAGDSLYMVGKILGHRRVSTTQRYAHLAIEPVRQVADRTAEQLFHHLNF